MTRRTGEDVLTREEADRRIRGTARVASALCWVAAALALALAAWSLFAAAWVTWSSARASGTDLVTAFLTTSEASGDFVLAETEPQDPVYRYDDEGNVVGMAQTGAGTVSLRGNPLQLTARGVVSAGLSGAVFALAALLCGRVRRTGDDRAVLLDELRRGGFALGAAVLHGVGVLTLGHLTAQGGGSCRGAGIDHQPGHTGVQPVHHPHKGIRCVPVCAQRGGHALLAGKPGRLVQHHKGGVLV